MSICTALFLGGLKFKLWVCNSALELKCVGMLYVRRLLSRRVSPCSQVGKGGELLLSVFLEFWHEVAIVFLSCCGWPEDARWGHGVKLFPGLACSLLAVRNSGEFHSPNFVLQATKHGRPGNEARGHFITRYFVELFRFQGKLSWWNSIRPSGIRWNYWTLYARLESDSQVKWRRKHFSVLYWLRNAINDVTKFMIYTQGPIYSPG